MRQNAQYKIRPTNNILHLCKTLSYHLLLCIIIFSASRIFFFVKTRKKGETYCMFWCQLGFYCCLAFICFYVNSSLNISTNTMIFLLYISSRLHLLPACNLKIGQFALNPNTHALRVCNQQIFASDLTYHTPFLL